MHIKENEGGDEGSGGVGGREGGNRLEREVGRMKTNSVAKKPFVIVSCRFVAFILCLCILTFL